MKTIYLDHNSTTMMEQSAYSALLFFSSSSENFFGNASSIHWAGRKVKSALDDARDQVAQAFGVDESEICFCSGATEATNAALKGAFFLAKKEQKSFHLITSSVEHEATIETANFLLELGACVTFLPVDSKGCLSLEDLKRALGKKSDFTLVSLMAANNETGVVFPWEEAALMAKSAGAVFHLDAVQAPGKLLGFSLKNMPVDLASFSSHKIGGAKGVGALFVKKGQKLVSLLHGGAQEKRRRAGTINVPGIVSFGAAALALQQKNPNNILALRNILEDEVKKRISGTHLHGEDAPRIVNTSNFLFDGVRGEALVTGLDIEGFAVSSGSACNSGSILPSHVLLAMGRDKLSAQSAVRISLGYQNTEDEIRDFILALERVVQRIRSRQ